MIGQRIKEFVEKSRYSLPEVAQKLGTTTQNMYKIFSKHSVQTNILEKLSAVLDIPVTIFFEDEKGIRINSNEQEVLLEKVDNLKKRVAELEDSLKMSKTLMEIYKKISNDNGLHALALQNPDVFKQILSPERLREVELFEKEVGEMERTTNLRFENGEIIWPADDEIIDINYVQQDRRTPINKKERDMFIEALKKKYKTKSM